MTLNLNLYRRLWSVLRGRYGKSSQDQKNQDVKRLKDFFVSECREGVEITTIKEAERRTRTVPRFNVVGIIVEREE